MFQADQFFFSRNHVNFSCIYLLNGGICGYFVVLKAQIIERNISIQYAHDILLDFLNVERK
jgi:hypothetical protein